MANARSLHQYTQVPSYRILEFSLFLTLAVMWFVWFAQPLLGRASENLRLVQAFSADEASVARPVAEAIAMRTINLSLLTYMPRYPHLYLNTALLPLTLASYFFPISERAIIIALRFISLCSAIGCVAVVFLLAQRFFGRTTAWLSGCLMCLIPSNTHYSIIAKPDITQLFFTICALYFAMAWVKDQAHKSRWLVLASALSGLAFATKYGGLHILAFIWAIALLIAVSEQHRERDEFDAFKNVRLFRLLVAAIGVAGIGASIIFTPSFIYQHHIARGPIPDQELVQSIEQARILAASAGLLFLGLAALKPLWGMLTQRPAYIVLLRRLVISTLAFVAAFVLTSPFSFVRLMFIRNIYSASRELSTGGVWREGSSGLLWFNVIVSPSLLSVGIASFALIGLMITVYGILKHRTERLLEPNTLLWLWTIGYLVYLIVGVRWRLFRFALPVLPSAIILSAYAAETLIKHARSTSKAGKLVPSSLSERLLFCNSDLW